MPASAPDFWHFARPALARDLLAPLAGGLVSAQVIAAPRRMGKTEFLTRDLSPAATQAGYTVAYADLWREGADPCDVVVDALANALDVKRESLRSRRGDTAAHAALLAMTPVLDHFPTPCLVILDEAQVLTAPRHSNFLHALRSVFDARRSRIKVIFAGSATTALHAMFALPMAPFYQWAMMAPFPLLGDEFVAAMLERVAAISKHPLDLAQAQHAFNELQRVPEYFRAYLNAYLLDPLSGSGAALAAVQAVLADDASFARTWAQLLPADRLLLEMLADGMDDVYGLPARTQLGEALGLDGPVSKSTAQNALTRLVNKNIVGRLDFGKYGFEDEAFAQWIRRRDR